MKRKTHVLHVRRVFVESPQHCTDGPSPVRQHECHVRRRAGHGCYGRRQRNVTVGGTVVDTQKTPVFLRVNYLLDSHWDQGAIGMVVDATDFLLSSLHRDVRIIIHRAGVRRDKTINERLRVRTARGANKRPIHAHAAQRNKGDKDEEEGVGKEGVKTEETTCTQARVVRGSTWNTTTRVPE